ncbi:MAG: tryptophan--tRNA ligase [Thermodesulfobacteriota bacteirum]|jgi:tryptophanyl-tRNA synthetase|nr:tryptophan--tRNA ligase [Thermodesulfobacteriota bacterium]|tara:strand:- start:1756 stop:2766 length:1011 start_codon:yes stop_codon:yes gene_type:complete
MNDKNKSKILVTGDRPTGSLHLGHYVGTLENRIKLQDSYDCFFLIADLHMLTTHQDKVDGLNENIIELVIDWLSVGLDPSKSCFYLQSKIPEISELTVLMSMLCSVPRIQRIPTLKEKIASMNLSDNYSLGLLSYPVLMSSDILVFNASAVPVGEDQLSHVELTRELARRFNSSYKDILIEPEPLVSKVSRLVGTDGQGKMSKSLNNSIYLSDSEDEVKKKVMKMYTDPNRTSADVPGKVEGNPVFIYHDIFNSDKEELDDFKDRYSKGKIGDVEVKKSLIRNVNNFLDPIRQKRREILRNKGEILDIIIEGSKRAREVARDNLELIKDAMSLNFR